MSETTAEKIVAAAERRMRAGGYHGFSFREVAADVGVKSASVHHHFATKERLAAAVAEDYADRFLEALGDPEDPARRPEELIAAFVARFRAALVEDRLMCLCGALAAERASLPEAASRAATAFFERNLAWLATVYRRARPEEAADAARARAVRTIALLEGAMLVAAALEDDAAFEEIAAAV